MTQNNTTNLDKFAVNLTAKAKTGKLDPIIGRDDEIRRILQILSRRTKNNPVIVGESGVGKTAIVEGIAHRIIRGDVPENLKEIIIYIHKNQQSHLSAHQNGCKIQGHKISQIPFYLL